MSGAFFEPAGAGEFVATAHTGGPWSPDFMHAGPPTALLARAAVRAVGLAGVRLGRICVEILSPVLVGPVEVSAMVVRPGSRVALVESTLLVRGRPSMLARSWFIREADVPAPPSDVVPPPAHGEWRKAPDHWVGGYLRAIDWRWVSGGFESLGPGTVWARPRVDLVAGESATPTERLLMVADSASGVSAVASPRESLFINTELTVHLRREPHGDWVWLSANTRTEPNGSGVTSGVLGDCDGDLGTTGQLLFLQAISPPAPSA